MKTIDINPWQEFEFKKSMKLMFWLLLLHTHTVLIASIWGSTEMWGAVSGPGFFVIFGIYFIIELAKKRMRAKEYQNEEWLPLVDNEGKVVGQAPRKVVHSGSKLLHPVVHLHVLNNGSVYLQKRSMNKLVQPGKWDTAVGGHISAGENIEKALERESFEEIGLRNFQAGLMAKYIWESEIESELVFSFVSHYKGVLQPNPDEVEEGRFWSFSEVKQNLGKEVFTPNFEKEFELLMGYVEPGSVV